MKRNNLFLVNLTLLKKHLKVYLSKARTKMYIIISAINQKYSFMSYLNDCDIIYIKVYKINTKLIYYPKYDNQNYL